MEGRTVQHRIEQQRRLQTDKTHYSNKKQEVGKGDNKQQQEKHMNNHTNNNGTCESEKTQIPHGTGSRPNL